MSRSFRKTPKSSIIYYDSSGEMKKFKRLVNKKIRSLSRECLFRAIYMDPDSVSYPLRPRDGEDIWSSPADGGKYWFGHLRESNEDSYSRRIRK